MTPGVGSACRRLSRRHLLVLGGSAVVVSLFGGCTSTATRSSGRAAPNATVVLVNPAGQEKSLTSAVMIGDSITLGSNEALTASLSAAGIVNLTIDGVASRRIAVGNGTSEPLAGLKVIEQQRAAGANPDVWIIALGTNDVGGYPDAAAYTALIDSVIAMLPADSALVWVDVYRETFLQDTELFNTLLRDRLAARGNAVVVSWFDQVSVADSGLLQSDRLHPNEQGRLVFANLVAAAINR